MVELVGAARRRGARERAGPLTGRASRRTVHGMVEWKFQRRQGACGTCERAFEEGARHVSVLSARGEDLAREDQCLACWAQRAGSDDLFWWFTRHSANRRGLQLDLPTLEHVFVRLEGRSEARIRELRYVLCLLLMRKRRLKLLRMQRGEPESMLVRRPRRDESFQVFVFDFAPERVEELRGELAAIFDGAEPGEPPVGEEGAPPVLAVSGAS